MGSNLPAARPLKGLKARKAKRAYLLAFTTVSVCQVSDAMAVAGITLGQLQKWREADAEFAALEEQVRTQLKDDTLRKQIDAYVERGDRDIIKAAMKRLPEYNPAKETKLSVSGTLKHEHVDKLPEAELNRIILAGAECVEAEFEVLDERKAITKD